MVLWTVIFLFFLPLLLRISKGIETWVVLPAFLTSLEPWQAGQGSRSQGQYSGIWFLHSASSKDAFTFKALPHTTQGKLASRRNGEEETLQSYSLGKQ